MRIVFDPAKSARNLETRGLSFEMAEQFDFESALFLIDDREGYGEERVRAFGNIGERLHVLVDTMRGETLRVISLRKANAREVRKYEQATKAHDGR